MMFIVCLLFVCCDYKDCNCCVVNKNISPHTMLRVGGSRGGGIFRPAPPGRRIYPINVLLYCY